jgi:hypothetical protein
MVVTTTTRQRRMFHELRVGESIVIQDGDHQTAVTLEQKSGQKARLRIEADQATRIITPARA